MTDQPTPVDLMHFTFHSLYFAGVPVEHLSGERFMTAVNRWYMPLIRSGWAVPLSFVLDVGTLLQRPSTGFKCRWKEGVRDELRQVSLRYYQMLQGLRRQPVFGSVVDCIAQAPHQSQRDQATRTFLRFLLSELGHFRNTYSFNTRELKVTAARPTADGIRDVRMEYLGKTRKGNMTFGDPASIKGRNEFGTLFELIKEITDYYTAQPLNSLISAEELLMVEVVSRSPNAAGRIDYRFLHELLGRAELSEPEPLKPRPPRIEQLLPTDSYDTDGNVGGYIDVNRRKFDGSLAGIVPAELAFLNHRQLMTHRLLNEGMLHFVREDIECIERELQVLVCVVVDVDERMMTAPTDVHTHFGKGMTPYVRARVLAALLLMDIARHLPREDVHVDCAIYLWSQRARHTFRTEFDLFDAFPQAVAEDRFTFAKALADRTAHMYFNRLTEDASRQNPALDRDPGQYVQNRCHTRTYHCRHMVFLTSEHSAARAFPDTEPGLNFYDNSRDSLFLVHCDVTRTTTPLFQPRSFGAARDLRPSDVGARLSEERLRARILDTIIRKAADRAQRHDVDQLLSELT